MIGLSLDDGVRLRSPARELSRLSERPASSGLDSECVADVALFSKYRLLYHTCPQMRYTSTVMVHRVVSPRLNGTSRSCSAVKQRCEDDYARNSHQPTSCALDHTLILLTAVTQPLRALIAFIRRTHEFYCQISAVKFINVKD